MGEPETPKAERTGWLGRLRQGLARSSSKLGEGIAGLFGGGGRKLDKAALAELEEILIGSDLGPATAAKLVEGLAARKFEQDITDVEIRAALAEQIEQILSPVAVPLEIDAARKPHVVLVVGVNGSGKTTTIGKLAHHLRDEGRSVMLAAGDTFRAAAIEQLKIWAERTGAEIVAKNPGADAAGVAYEAFEQAKRQGTDVLLVDTAGRLQNKKELMAGLDKIVRVIKKLDETAPHTVLLVLDATVGQNAHSQVEVFREVAKVSGLAVTKLDGTAKGGVVVALAERFKLPVHAIGVGESAEDLRPFEAREFARSLMGLED
ncbi:MAG: signal recognition particle-docking protein FtsY [Alphaproteobacteria bacterium]